MDPQGEETATNYSSFDYEPKESIGPAPTACFSTTGGTTTANPPSTPGCGVVPADTTTTYDGGLTGLNATYYNEIDQEGTPGGYALGLGTGDIDQTWGSTSDPISGISPTNWSMTLTGTITFPSSTSGGDVLMSLDADNSASLYVDDILVAGVRSTGITDEGIVHVPAAGGTKRIEITYNQKTGDASLDLQWTTPRRFHPCRCARHGSGARLRAND